MATIFMFSGQGSQYYQMGRELYDREPSYRYWFDRLDRRAVELGGRNMARILYTDERPKTDLFDALILTNPAIFIVEFAIAMTLVERGVVPNLTLGSSLGIFAAAAMSGAVDPFDALALVIRIANLFETHSPRGGMLAVLASPAQVRAELLAAAEIVSVTFDGHFTLSAPTGALEAIEAGLAAASITSQKLPVLFPFHSRWIDGMEDRFTQALAFTAYQPPRTPIICCARVGAIEKPEALAFWKATRGPIRLRETIERLELTGPHRYIDSGPSGTLSTLLKYVLPADSRSETAAVATPFGRDLRNLTSLTAAHARSAH